MPSQTYRAIGLMSGSSLDGLDIACCDFTVENGQWRFAISHADCAFYDEVWTVRLRDAHQANGLELWQLHADFGHFCGAAVRDFVAKHKLIDVVLVASHGHTVFHYPPKGFTTQIGDGAALAAKSGLPVVCDFRSGDVAKGGQGAPLVPTGDRLLFGDYRFLLNLGGIANMTVQGKGGNKAFDICSANQVLNFYAQKCGQAYDKDGALAARGKLNEELLVQLNTLDFYALPYPKSLGNNFTREIVLPLLARHVLPPEDILHTYCEHIAVQIAQQVQQAGFDVDEKMLATGGGALNTYLMQRLQQHMKVKIVQPSIELVQHKEAMVFALLGVLRWCNEVNVLADVTGATGDSCTGAIYLP